MTRVLHVGAGNLYGGIEAMLVTLARYHPKFPDLEHAFALCFSGRLRDELTAAGAAVHDLGAVRFSRPWTTWLARRRLAALLRREHYDAVICHSNWPYVLGAPTARSAKQRLIYWGHDSVGQLSLLERWASRIAPDGLVANSRFTASTFGALFPGVPPRVIYCPVTSGADSKQMPGEALEAARSAAQVQPDDVWVLMVSRMEAWKGHTLLLDALARLRELPGWRCSIAGGAQRTEEVAYLGSLQQRVRDLQLAERVGFLGQRRDVPTLMRAADIFCHPNLGPEPFGIVFVEALYAGLPVVATNMGGAAEIVDASCGILIPPADPDRLAEALSELIRDKTRRQTLGAAGPARAATLSDPAQTNRALLELIHSLS